MALMCMAQAPDIFQAGVAVAPVADWKLCDTHYAERYLGFPKETRYERSNVFPYLAGLLNDSQVF